MNAERIFVPAVFATETSSEKSLTSTLWEGCTWTKKLTRTLAESLDSKLTT